MTDRQSYGHGIVVQWNQDDVHGVSWCVNVMGWVQYLTKGTSRGLLWTR